MEGYSRARGLRDAPARVPPRSRACMLPGVDRPDRHPTFTLYAHALFVALVASYWFGWLALGQRTDPLGPLAFSPMAVASLVWLIRRRSTPAYRAERPL